MEITVSARHLDVSEALRSTATEKIGRLSRFLPGMDRAEVHFFEERNPRITAKDVCEVTMEGHGHHVRTRVAAADCFAAVDAATDKLEQQLHKLKTKLQRRTHAKRGNSVHSAEAVSTMNGTEADVEVEPPIVKSKRFAMKPMTIDEASLHLDLLGHDFYFFSNADSGCPAVLYRRNDGALGLIEQSV